MTGPGNRKAPRRRWAWLRDLVIAVLAALIVAAGAALYYTDRYEVASDSMEPTLVSGDKVWAVRRFEPPGRGDVVAFRWEPAGGGATIIKRVVGLPGERIESLDGAVMVNFAPIDESYYTGFDLVTSDFGPIELGPDEYFVMGDNREQSIDSRHFGAVPVETIGYLVRLPEFTPHPVTRATTGS